MMKLLLVALGAVSVDAQATATVSLPGGGGYFGATGVSYTIGSDDAWTTGTFELGTLEQSGTSPRAAILTLLDGQIVEYTAGNTVMVDKLNGANVNIYGGVLEGSNFVMARASTPDGDGSCNTGANTSPGAWGAAAGQSPGHAAWLLYNMDTASFIECQGDGWCGNGGYTSCRSLQYTKTWIIGMTMVVGSSMTPTVGGVLRATPIQQCATTGCPCISYPWAGSTAFENDAGTLDTVVLGTATEGCVVTAGTTEQETAVDTTCTLTAATAVGADATANPAVNGTCARATGSGTCAYRAAAAGAAWPYPTTYGMDSCQAHDSAEQPYCADADGVALVDAPSWCASPWCFIDVTACDMANDPSSYFAGSNPALTYSYETCSATNTFADTSHDPSACDADHSGDVTALHCFVGGHPVAHSRCPCITAAAAAAAPRMNAAGAWPSDDAGNTLTVTLEGTDYEYPVGYGIANCAPHDANQAPYCADTNAQVNADAPDWCQSNWCFVDRANCQLAAAVPEGCAVGNGAGTCTLTEANGTVPGSCAIGAGADANATCIYTAFTAEVVPTPSSYFSGSVPVLEYSYATCQHLNTFQDTAADPQACNDQHSTVVADHCFTNGHRNAHVNCPCLTGYPWAGSGAFETPTQSSTDPVTLSPVGFGNATGTSVTYPTGYGMAACAPHDALLPPYCADGTGAALLDAPGWCTSNWCFVNVNECVGMQNADGSPAAPDPSSYFAGSTPTLVYSYQTCQADNTFIGTVHDNTATQLTAQVTYAIDITAIAAGTAQRTTFETEFKASIVAAMNVAANDVVINSIAAGSVVVDFTVWASAADSAAATTLFSTALTPDALTITSGGDPPAVASTTATITPVVVNCVETGNTANDCLATCAVAAATVVTAASGGGNACAGAYTCVAGNGACPATQTTAPPAPPPAASGATVATTMAATVAAAVVALY